MPNLTKNFEHVRGCPRDWNTEEQLEIWKKEKNEIGKNLSKYV